MKPEITEKECWWVIYGEEGTYYYPMCQFTKKAAEDDYPNFDSLDSCTGYGSRLSMPGFLDCTQWAVFDTAAEAAEDLLNQYYDRPDDEMTAEEVLDRLNLKELAVPNE